MERRECELKRMARRATDGGIVYWYDRFVNGRLSTALGWLIQIGAIGVIITLLYDNLVYQKKIADIVVVNTVHIEGVKGSMDRLSNLAEGNRKTIVGLELCAAGMKKDVSHLRRDVDKLMAP